MTGEPSPGADVWGDETGIVRAAADWAARRVVRHTDSKTTARPASELAAAAGHTVTPGGIGATAALRIFGEILEPATRSQDDPMNLAYIPSAPTRAAVAFDLVTSAANVFAGIWEAGAGAIHAENEALGWLIELLGWPPDAAGCFVAGGTIGNLSALSAARHAALGRRGGRPPGDGRLACTTEVHSSIRIAARVLDVGVLEVPVNAAATSPARRCRRRSRTARRTSSLSWPPPARRTPASWTTSWGCRHVRRAGACGCTSTAPTAARGSPRPASGTCSTGIERADSFIVDPTSGCSPLRLLRAAVPGSRAAARRAHSQTGGLPRRARPRGVTNPADLAIHLSRRARGLPFWFSLATHGTDRYIAAIERTLATTRTVAAAIEASGASASARP